MRCHYRLILGNLATNRFQCALRKRMVVVINQRAAQDMLARTDTRHAPWTIVPADDKRRARLAVLRTLGDRIEAAIG